MLTTKLCRRMLVVTGWCVGMAGPSCFAEEEVALPEPIRAGLSRYADLTTVSMKWKQRARMSSLASGRLDESKIQYFSLPRDLYLVWQGGHMYLRTIMGEDTHEFAFDGRVVAGGRFATAGGHNRVLRKDLAADLDTDAEYFGVESLHWLGIRFPYGVGRLVDGQPLQSFVLYLLEQGARIKAVDTAELDDRSMQRISLLVENPTWRLLQDLDMAELDAQLHRSAETEEWIQEHLASVRRAKETTSPELMYVFYLDPQMGYAVRRWQDLTVEGRLRMQADCTAHKRLPEHQIWLPRKCQVDEFTFDSNYSGEIFDKPFQTKVLQVSEFDTKPVPNELFTLDYQLPGAEIADATLPEAKLGKGPVYYTVPVDLKELDRTVEQARKFQDVQSEKSGKWGARNPMSIPLIVGNSLVIVVLLFYLSRRYRSGGT